MSTAEPYARWTQDGVYDAIVIGSGIGGLSAAALLAKHAGKRVLVLERHYRIGGFTHFFRLPGYECDVGVHYIGDVRPGTGLRTLFDDVTGGELEWADLGPVYDRVAIGGRTFDFPAGRENLRCALKREFPAEVRAIDAYLERVQAVVDSMGSFFTTTALPPPLALLAGPWLRRKFLAWASRTTREVLESLTRDEALIGVLTAQCGDYGLPPGRSSFAIHAVIANHYFEGAFYPVGGARRIAETILPVIEAAGGRALINAEVARAVTERGLAVGVQMAADAAAIRAPLVISDAGVATTARRLLSPDAAELSGLLPVLQRLAPSIAHLALYVGLRHTAEELRLPRANLWVHRDTDHDRSLAAATRAYGPLPFAYTSFPSAKDPDFARRHPGRATIDVISLVPYERFRRWESLPRKKRGADYEALKQRLARELLAVLYEHLPQVEGKIDTFELSTRHFANAPCGEIYGPEHTPARYAEKRLAPRTAIRGLYLTGQDVVSCGVVGALMGGALTASAILRRNLIGRFAKAAQADAPESPRAAVVTAPTRRLSRAPPGSERCRTLSAPCCSLPARAGADPRHRPGPCRHPGPVPPRPPTAWAGPPGGACQIASHRTESAGGRFILFRAPRLPLPVAGQRTEDELDSCSASPRSAAAGSRR